MKWFCAVLLAVFVVVPAQAQTRYRLVTSTPDIHVGRTSTLEVVFPTNRISFQTIKNDCGASLYFDLNPPSGGAGLTTSYPIRLDPGQSFTGHFTMGPTLGVSHGSTGHTASTLCPITVIMGTE